MNGHCWGADEIGRLRDMWTENLSATQISAAFAGKVSRSAVCGMARRLGLPERRPGMNCHLRHAQIVGARVAKSLAPVKMEDEPEPIGLPGEIPDNGCKWPVNKQGETFRCCGHKRHERRPYCQHHASRGAKVTTGGSSGISVSA